MSIVPSTIPYRLISSLPTPKDIHWLQAAASDDIGFSLAIDERAGSKSFGDLQAIFFSKGWRLLIVKFEGKPDELMLGPLRALLLSEDELHGDHLVSFEGTLTTLLLFGDINLHIRVKDATSIVSLDEKVDFESCIRFIDVSSAFEELSGTSCVNRLEVETIRRLVSQTHTDRDSKVKTKRCTRERVEGLQFSSGEQMLYCRFSSRKRSQSYYYSFSQNLYSRLLIGFEQNECSTD